MKKLTIFLLLLLLCGCITQQEKGEDKIKVVVSIPPLYEFVKEIGKDRVDVEILLPPGANPHTFEPTPKQIKYLQNADLIIINGGGLEFWIDNLLKLKGTKAKVIDTSKGVQLIYEGERANPHIWLSPKNAKIQVENIYRALIEIEPSFKYYYYQNKEKYIKKLEELDEYAKQKFKNKDRRTILSLHSAWAYLARDYNLTLITILENDREPSPKHLMWVIKKAREEKISHIIVEKELNPKSAEVIAKEINATLVFVEPLSTNYIQSMHENIDKIGEALQ
ncbi:MAG: zinc ABC transporter substrate-binding protein [Thermoplasmata archaeon]|nr:MAG: zinc ABC transporter substrate-binding protein [Thermoplasmata archaeon]